MKTTSLFQIPLKAALRYNNSLRKEPLTNWVMLYYKVKVMIMKNHLYKSFLITPEKKSTLSI